MKAKLPVTAVIMNWRRPENVGKITFMLREHLDEVIVLDASGSPHNLGLYDVMTARDFGLHARFATGLLARNTRVLIQDDDLVTDRAGLETLFEAHHACNVLHGVFGRRPLTAIKSDGDMCYDGRDLAGNCEVVLTRMVMTSRTVLGEFFAHLDDYYDVLMSGTPPGNGEDIALSYVAMRRTGCLNVALGRDHVKITELPAPHAIHSRTGSSTGHWAHRTKVLRHMDKWLKEKRQHGS